MVTKNNELAIIGGIQLIVFVMLFVKVMPVIWVLFCLGVWSVFMLIIFKYVRSNNGKN